MIITHLFPAEGVPPTDTAQNRLALLKTLFITGTAISPVDNGAVLSGGLLTLGFTTQKTYQVGQTIEIQGANDAQHNTLYRVLEAQPSSVTVKAVDNVQPTGAMTVRIPPFGWELINETASTLYMRPVDPTTNNLIYSFEYDSGDWVVRAYETNTDVSENRRLPNLYARFDAVMTLASALVGDGTGVYICNNINSGGVLVYMGTVDSQLPGDRYKQGAIQYGGGESGGRVHRDTDGVTKTPYVSLTFSRLRKALNLPDIPVQPGVNHLHYVPVYLIRNDGSDLRAKVPGLYVSRDRYGYSIGGTPVIPKVLDVGGEQYLALNPVGSAGFAIALTGWGSAA